MNWTLLSINIAVFVYVLSLSAQPDVTLLGQKISAVDKFYYDWGLVPSCFADFLKIGTDANPRAMQALCPAGDREILQPFTSMFIHAGPAHIVGNMLFLWIFGDNVEDRLGHFRYLVFYLLAGLAAGFTQVYLTSDSLVPAVGASGAIAGVLAAYLVTYPTAMVQVIILPLFFLPFFMPAVALIAIWFITQLFSGIAEMGNATAGSGVAWWAHVGGFVSGAVLIVLLRPPDRRPSIGTRHV